MQLCPAGKHDTDVVGLLPASPSRRAKGHYAPTCRGCHKDRNRRTRRHARLRLQEQRPVGRIQGQAHAVPLRVRDWSKDLDSEDAYITELVYPGCNPSEQNWIKAASTWMKDALCAEADPDLFFPPDEEETTEEAMERVRLAKQICAQCPVRAECLDYAMDNEERIGVWGGMAESGRKTLRGIRNRRKVDA
jgi:WhiB family transcriptional regulator, redox-sensing transcriptional regulator